MLDLMGSEPPGANMSCFLLPSSSPYLKVAFLRPVVYGYQGYPGTPVSAVTATTAGATAPRFPQQPLAVPPPVANGSYCQVTTAIGAAQTASQTVTGSVLRSAFPPQTGFKPSTGNFHRGHFRTGFHKNGRGVKRKAEDGATDSDGKSDSGSVSGEYMRPLYCEICRVTLNAPSQAKQHYEGKNHSKRMKLYSEGDSTDTPSSGSTSSTGNSDTKTTSTSKPSGSSLSNGQSSGSPSPASSITSNSSISSSNCSSNSNGSSSNNNQSNSTSTTTTTTTTTTVEINPEVYCRTCGVSFNSPKQAQQHYKGKNHAKKVRATNSANNNHNGENATSNKMGTRYNCYPCNSNVTSQEQLDGHLKGSRPNKVKVPDRSQRSLKGRWAVSKSSGEFPLTGLKSSSALTMAPAVDFTSRVPLQFPIMPQRDHFHSLLLR